MRSSISSRVSARSGIAPCGWERNARSWSAVTPLRATFWKLGGPCGTALALLSPITWQLAHHCRAICAPLLTSARAACAAMTASINNANIVVEFLEDTLCYSLLSSCPGLVLSRRAVAVVGDPAPGLRSYRALTSFRALYFYLGARAMRRVALPHRWGPRGGGRRGGRGRGGGGGA